MHICRRMPAPSAFRHGSPFARVYLSPQKHRDNLAGDAAQLLVRLNQAGSEADATALGDALMLDDRYIAASASEVSSQFGAKFAEQLAALTPGQWQGPVDSGYGVHLVLVTERSDGRLPALGEIRDAVRRVGERPAFGGESEVL